jgi:hypothetical protein
MVSFIRLGAMKPIARLVAFMGNYGVRVRLTRTKGAPFSNAIARFGRNLSSKGEEPCCPNL